MVEDVDFLTELEEPEEREVADLEESPGVADLEVDERVEELFDDLLDDFLGSGTTTVLIGTPLLRLKVSTTRVFGSVSVV
jgi:hypothetical protein